MRLYAYRLARVWGGAIGVASFGLLLLDLLTGARHVTMVLVAAWAAIPLAFTAAWFLGAWRLRRLARAAAGSSGDLFTDLERLERWTVWERAGDAVARLERKSFVLPLVALSLLLPLTLHLFVAAVLLSARVEEFNTWIVISLVLVGHAHAVLAVLAVRHVTRVQRETASGWPVGGGKRGMVALFWTVAASTVPGAVLLFVPPILVAVTGVVFVPLMFHWAGAAAERELVLLRSLMADRAAAEALQASPVAPEPSAEPVVEPADSGDVSI